jgi:DNA repair exonuclease SbcCD ATPase subunit
MQLQGQAWDEVQDRLLGTLSVDNIRPARVVIEELEDEATDLWRTDNRGKPEAKQLEQKRRELREAAGEARERDQKIRTLKDEIAEHTERIEALKEEEVELKGKQRRAERLAPVRSLLRQIDELEARAGDRSAYEDLPQEPNAVLDDLEETISDLEARVEDKRGTLRRLQRALDARTEEDDQLLEHADAIRGWTRRIERHQKQRVDLEEARRAAAEAERRVQDAASFLSEPWDDAYADPLRTLSMADLRERIKMYERAERRLRETRARAETVGLHAQARKSLVPWIVVAVLGLATTGVGVVVSLPVAGVPVAGGALTLLGILQAVAAWRHNQQIDTQEETLDLEGKERAAEERAAQVELLVDDLPLPPERLEHPSPDLVTDLKTLKEALRERDAKARAAEEQAAEVEEAETELRTLALGCGLSEEEANQSVAEVVATLERRLDAAEERAEAAQEAKDEVPDLRPEVETLADRLSEVRDRRESIVTRLEELGDGDLDAGVDELEKRRQAARRAEASRDRLHSEYPDWEERKAEIDELESEEGGWTFPDEERARIEQRLEEIAEERREEEKDRTAKEKEVEHLLDQRTVGDIDSELAHLNRRLEEVQQERDRRLLLAGLLRRADTEFRRKHQPDVIRRASAYLETITQGRYERLSLDEQEDRLVVYEAGEAFSQPVGPPLSQGTLDQIYLALRLAIIDHLDADRERLPVFLDEVFVNWDKPRRHAAFEILQDMAQERQLFVFTCHPFFAEETTEHLGAERIDLTALRTNGNSTPGDRSEDLDPQDARVSR